MILRSPRAKGTAFCRREAVRSAVMGWGLLGCPCGTLSLSPAGLHLPICEVTWGGVLVPPFLKEGRKSPCATAHPVIWGRWQPRGTEDAAPCGTATSSSVFVGKPRGSTGWVFGPHFFRDSAPNGYGGGCQRCPKPQPSTALKYLYPSEGKASPWCGWEPPATGFPCEGGRWSPL